MTFITRIRVTIVLTVAGDRFEHPKIRRTFHRLQIYLNLLTWLLATRTGKLDRTERWKSFIFNFVWVLVSKFVTPTTVITSCICLALSSQMLTFNQKPETSKESADENNIWNYCNSQLFCQSSPTLIARTSKHSKENHREAKDEFTMPRAPFRNYIRRR